MNKAAHEAIAATYFYIEGLHRTCLAVSGQTQLMQNNCPGDTKELQRDLVILEGKAYAVRTLMDEIRRYDNITPGFPQGNPCVECTFAQYRYNPGIDFDTNAQNVHNLVPYPFYPADNGNMRHPYAVYQSKAAALTAPGVSPSQEIQPSYRGDIWQQAWNSYDLQYINPNSPVSTPVTNAGYQDYTAATPAYVSPPQNNTAPYQSGNGAYTNGQQPVQQQPQQTPQQQPQQKPQQQPQQPAQPNLNATPVPWGFSDTSK